MYATEYRSDSATSPKNRCINKNENGPKILVPQAPLVDLKTQTSSYSALEAGQITQRTRNKNLRDANVLNTSVPSNKMPITPNNEDGVLNNTEQEHSSASTSSIRNRCVNKNANGPKYRGSRAPLTNSMTTRYSYSALESGQVAQRTRNKNLRGLTFLNTSDTAATTPITPTKTDCVLNDTEQSEIKASDNILRTAINKNMQHVVNNLNLHLKQTHVNNDCKDNCLSKANTGALSTITPLLDAPTTATIHKAPQSVNIGAKHTEINVASHLLEGVYLNNLFANINIQIGQVETVNSMQVQDPIFISVEARPGHYYNPVVYDRPLY